MVYVYAVYSDDRTSHFNTHKMAFKLFFWAMIRTGNPQFAGECIKMKNGIKLKLEQTKSCKLMKDNCHFRHFDAEHVQHV